MMKFKAIAFLFWAFIIVPLHARPTDGFPPGDFRFDHLGIRDGLSQSTVLSIFQDSRGFMWLGTRDGLNRYDGYRFRVYCREQGNPRSIGGNVINSISEDREGNIWVATDQGVSRYDAHSDTFSSYRLPGADPEAAEVRKVFVDGRNRVWTASRRGLFVWEKKTGRLVPAPQLFPFLKEVADHSTNSVYQPNPSSFWIGTYRHGLYLVDLESRTARHHPPGRFGSAKLDALAGDQDGALWVGAGGQGVYRLSAAGEITLHLSAKSPDSLRLSHDNIRDLAVDNAGNVWIGTFRGVTVYSPGRNTIRRTYAVPGNPTGLSHNSVRSLYRDRKGSIWIGTYFGGVSVFDADNLRFNHFHHIPGVDHSLSYNVVGAFTEDARGHLLIGTEGGGLNRYDPARQQHTALLSVPGNPATLSGNTVKSLYRDRKNRVWAGIFRGGLNRVDTQTGRVQRFPAAGDQGHAQLATVIVNCITEDANGFLWLGTDTHGGSRNLTRSAVRSSLSPPPARWRSCSGTHR